MDTQHPEIVALTERADLGEEITCPEVDAAARAADVPEDEIHDLCRMLEERGAAIDCSEGRTTDAPVAITVHDLAHTTTDALQLFMNEVARHRPPTDEEVAEASGLEVEQVVALRDASRVVTSLDRPVGEEESTAFGDLLPADGMSTEEEVELTLRESVVRETLEALPERERTIIKMRHGLNGQQDPQPPSRIGREPR